ncbi:MAG: HDOD domain-containing protein [Thermodesulfobacteriota bacterium]
MEQNKAGHDEQTLAPDIKNHLSRIGRLAAMPQVVWQLMDALADDTTRAASLEKIIESDMALASKVLSLANSAFYGLHRQVTSINRAVVIIGFKELGFLSLGSGLADFFDLKKVPAGFDGQGLWLHCLAVSWTARELAERAFHLNAGEVMVAGLLHDLGKLVLAAHLPDQLARIMEQTRQGVPYHEAETRVGLPHTLLGHCLAENWGLPAVHATVIRNHHAPPADGPHQAAVNLVALADGLVKMMEFGLVQEARAIDKNQALAGSNLSEIGYNAVNKSARDRLPALRETWLAMLSRRT